jgi:hypothetical protein
MKLLKQIFSSKKALVGMASVLVVMLQYFGAPIDEATVLKLLGIAGAYIIGQGLADNGKEAKKLEI